MLHKLLAVIMSLANVNRDSEKAVELDSINSHFPVTAIL